MKKLRSLTYLLASLAISSSAYAADFYFPIDVSTHVVISSSFSFSGISTTNQVTTTANTFTTDISQADNLIWEYQAPADLRVSISPAVASSNFLVGLQYFSGSSFGSIQSPQPAVQIEFIDLLGTAPSLNTATALYREDGDQVDSVVAMTFTDAFSFKGFRLITVGPFDSLGTLDYGDEAAPIATFQVNYTGGPIEQQVITFVPEPSSQALLGMGGLMLARRRRR